MMKNSIVLVPFPFDDFKSVKVRPVLCLTSEIGKFNHIVVSFISSNTKNKEAFDILLEKETSLFQGTGLHVDSVIKLHRIITIPKWIIKRKLGIINPELTTQIERNLKNLFDLKN